MFGETPVLEWKNRSPIATFLVLGDDKVKNGSLYYNDNQGERITKTDGINLTLDKHTGLKYVWTITRVKFVIIEPAAETGTYYFWEQGNSQFYQFIDYGTVKVYIYN